VTCRCNDLRRELSLLVRAERLMNDATIKLRTEDTARLFKRETYDETLHEAAESQMAIARRCLGRSMRRARVLLRETNPVSAPKLEPFLTHEWGEPKETRSLSGRKIRRCVHCKCAWLKRREGKTCRLLAELAFGESIGVDTHD